MVSETATIGDVLLNIRDTAGIRSAADEIEKIGIERSVSQIDECELVIGMFDSSRPCDENDEKVISLLEGAKERGKDVIAVMNKCDLERKFDASRLDGKFDVLNVVASDKNSKEIISEKIAGMYLGASDGGDAIVTNARQHASVKRAHSLCESALAALSSFGTDVAGSEIERAMAELSEMDGRQVGIDVVNEIFGKFCVGK